MRHMVIGIDPDVVKSGFAVWCSTEKALTKVDALYFADIIQFLTTNKPLIKFVVIEAGWLNKSNWHINAYNSKTGRVEASPQKAAEMGVSVGRNQQRGLDLIEICEMLEIPCRPIKPIKGNAWKTDGEYFKKLTGWQKRTNPESRDAAMLVYKIK